ncbi:MAG: hypothetical protein KBD78_12380 [Oligoflexales bacterium]|nr:hypothetical protein [Oligoflexales bacterium]
MKSKLLCCSAAILAATAITSHFYAFNPEYVREKAKHARVETNHPSKKAAAQTEKANDLKQESETLEKIEFDSKQPSKNIIQADMTSILAEQRRRVASLSDHELMTEITKLKHEFVSKRWLERINNQSTTDAENQQFQLLLRQHDALHLEKAERELIKIQNLLTEQ